MNEWREIRAVLTNDVSSPHLSPGIRVACLGAVHYGHEPNREPNCEPIGECFREPNRRYDNRYDGHHHGHNGNYWYHW